MGKNSVEDLHSVGSIGYCLDLHKDNPEYHEGDRFREIYQRDDSFANKRIVFSDKVVIDTSIKRKTGLVCIQIGDYPLLENPEYDENARFREIYVHDSSFEEVDVMAGSKIRIDTRRKGIICVQLGDFQPFLTIEKQHKDDMIFGFLNKNFAWFSCFADKVDSIVNFIGIPTDD
ncbi:MAG: hypothetical protein E7536_01465 [Ruminococcaceae bacterium]|nr:hypothetical protein [Oscillospiraceae bacterium]